MRPMLTVSPYDMVPVKDAIEAILALASPLESEVVDALSAEGRTLAETSRSTVAVPAGARSAVDGYAVRAADVGERSLIRHEISAGREQAVQVGLGEAVRIMTGGGLPAGADAVVMVEDTEERDGRLVMHRDVPAGANVHRTGQDIAERQIVLEAGTTLGAAEIGLLATVGQVRVKVYRRPRVSVLATGDELVEPAEEPPPGCIRDSNRYALLAAVREAGGDPAWSGVARDDEDELAHHFEAALAPADVVITSGGELEDELRPDPVRPEYQRAVVRWASGRLLARTTGAQGSSRLLSMAGANALLEIEAGGEPLSAGRRVPALLTAEILPE